MAAAVAAAAAALSTGAQAQHRIDWYSLNGGGGEASGGGYKINGSIGQSVAGFTSSTTFLHWIGFWASETRNPIVVTGIGALGTTRAGERQITGPIVIIMGTTTPLAPRRTARTRSRTERAQN